MELDNKVCSAVFHVARDSDGRWFATPDGESQRPIAVTDLIGMFMAASEQENNPVTSDAT